MCPKADTVGKAPHLRSETRKFALSWLPMSLFGALATIGGIVGFAAEQSHFLSAGSTPEQRISLIVAGSRQPGISSQTQRQFMIDCRNSVIQAVQIEMPVAERDNLARACQRAARNISESSPASSFAWFAQAHSALALVDWPEVNRTLALSQKAGTNEGWIARYRVELVEDNRSNIDNEYLEKNRQDLKVLAENMRSYQDFLARIYLFRPGSRADITNAIEEIPPQSQRIFLGAVDRARQNLGMGPS